MASSSRWMVAGAAAALLAGAARAGDEDPTAARTVQVIVGEASEGRVPATPGEPVRLVFNRTDGPEQEAIVLPNQGVVMALPIGEPVMLVVRSGQDGIDYSVRPQGDPTGAWGGDTSELAAGNTGGRG